MRKGAVKKEITLIELMITMVVGAIIAATIYGAYVYFFREVAKGELKAKVQRDADVVSYWIELTIREGSWAYLNEESDDSLVVENLTEGWRKTLWAEGGRLMIDLDGDEQEIFANLSSLHFYPRLGRVEYELELTEEGNTHRLNSSMNLRNVRYRGLWHFSEGSGDIAYDDSPYNNNAAIYGAGWTAGKIDTALAFDGENDYLYVPDNDELDSGRRVGYSAWVRAGSFAAPRTILNRNSVDEDHGFVRWYVENNEVRYSFNASGRIVTVGSGSLSWQAGTWYEVCVQHDDTQGRVHFYRDGIKVGESSYVGAMIPVTSGDLYIGAYQRDQHPWRGGLDEVKFVSL